MSTPGADTCQFILGYIFIYLHKIVLFILLFEVYKVYGIIVLEEFYYWIYDCYGFGIEMVSGQNSQPVHFCLNENEIYNNMLWKIR